MLIGASLFWRLLCVGQLRLGKDKPVLHETVFGWIVSGPITVKSPVVTVSCNVSVQSPDVDLHRSITKFWEVEHLLDKTEKYSNLTAEEQSCEDHFVANLSRDLDNRFVVRLPFKTDPNVLGDSRSHALKMFQILESKLKTNSLLRDQYISFMHEYISLGHMSLLSESAILPNYFLPHHGVIKESSTTTKLRVVFNASSPSSSGWSLNSLQMTGPTLQSDIYSILLRFRCHKYVIAADIQQMYRQVRVHPDDRRFQLIYWRDDPNKDLKVYTLNTVTYGTTSAPFLAVRCLFQAAQEFRDKNRDVAEVICRDFYVDDLLTGGDSIEQLADLCNSVDAVLKESGFTLRKWCSNQPDILNRLNVCNSSEIDSFVFDKSDMLKPLGLLWNPKHDELQYSCDISKFSNYSCSKRTVLSTIAKLYDPLGLLGPVIVKAKILMQYLWQLNMSWDEPLPPYIQEQWERFCEKLNCLNSLRIPRCVITVQDSTTLELHLFCDASVSAFGACAYVRASNAVGQFSVRLLTGKSRVAPLKPLSIPRLELCSALLAAELYNTVIGSLRLKMNRVCLWTDSGIVLHWINTPAKSLTTFVCNRVAEIQRLTPIDAWHHVSTEDNPADLLSRGVYPDQLNADLWWLGPPWLQQPDMFWPRSKVQVENKLLEFKPNQKFVLLSTTDIHIDIYINTFSTLDRLLNVTGWCLRFIKNCRSSKDNRIYSLITPLERENVLQYLIRLVQIERFSIEYAAFLKGKSCPVSSNLLALSPYLDEHGLIRVGGRLNYSDLSYEKRHPILLPKNHILTRLIFKNEHLRNLHCGPGALLAAIRAKYWPVSGRNMAKETVRSCMVCFRHNAVALQPLMADLPRFRVQFSPPFTNCCVDYGGPFKLKLRAGRGSASTKAYICLFICCATKAVHLELVSELSTNAFLAAYRRFISRRGRPINMYSDNGTNFVGADKQIQELFGFVRAHRDQICSRLSKELINWHFIPASSPHFGGLWEAGIKSTKYHLKRVVGDAMLTYEEFITVLTQIECILNSRPLIPLSSSPNDHTALTPAHFLSGRRLDALPDPNMMDVPINRLTRWQYQQRLCQEFWRRWSDEYLVELQRRNRWKTQSPNLSVNDLVLLKEDNLPPTQWCLGRIVEVHPGSDKIVRAVTVRTSRGTYRRAVCKVALLPMEHSVDPSPLKVNLSTTPVCYGFNLNSAPPAGVASAVNSEGSASLHCASNPTPIESAGSTDAHSYCNA